MISLDFQTSINPVSLCYYHQGQAQIEQQIHCRVGQCHCDPALDSFFTTSLFTFPSAPFHMRFWTELL